MKIKAHTVLQSHLSDIEIELEFQNDQEINERIQNRIGFIKFLNILLEGNFNKEIDPDFLYQKYLKTK